MNLKLLKKYNPEYEGEVQEMKDEVVKYFSYIKSFARLFPSWADERYIDNIYLVHSRIKETAIWLHDVERNMIDISHLREKDNEPPLAKFI